MIARKKKILLAQICLFFIAVILIFFTYINIGDKSYEKIITKKVKEEISKKIEKEDKIGNKFYDIEYTGIDLSGNRYILRAKEAFNSNESDDQLNLKFVNAIFYFKNDKVLNIKSNSGLYNNSTFDMIFKDKVIGEYDGSILLAERAEYFNSKNFLIISDNVKVKDLRGTILAEKLVFDIKENKLDISSSSDKKINALLNYK